jgi:hypothetical protein
MNDNAVTHSDAYTYVQPLRESQPHIGHAVQVERSEVPMSKETANRGHAGTWCMVGKLGDRGEFPSIITCLTQEERKR